MRDVLTFLLILVLVAKCPDALGQQKNRFLPLEAESLKLLAIFASMSWNMYRFSHFPIFLTTFCPSAGLCGRLISAVLSGHQLSPSFSKGFLGNSCVATI